MFDIIYDTYLVGGIKKYQMFTASLVFRKHEPIICQTSNLVNVKETDVELLQITTDNNDDIIVINGCCNKRERFVQNLQPEQFYQKPPSMSQRREVELFTKFQPLVPVQYQDIICPRPSKKVMEQVKADITEKRAARETKKKRKQKCQ